MLKYDFNNKTISVIGIGISNTPVISFFLAHGAKITARDRKAFNQLPQEVQAFALYAVTVIWTISGMR